MIRRYLPKSVEELAEWYMRYISPLALIAGFIADNLFLTRRVDLLQTNVLLFSYLVIAAGSIVLINLIQSGQLRHPIYLKMLPLVPVVAQFAFGGLFSGYLSLYSRSASISVSWVFVIVIAGLLIGNERFVRFYSRFSFQVALYFTVLFSFLIFFLPVVFHQIGPWMFLISGLMSLGIVALLLMLLARLIPEVVLSARTTVARAIAVIFLTFNVLYFTGAIPPLPLALKDAGVYHQIGRQEDGSYKLTFEPVPWYDFLHRYNTTYHALPGESVYALSSIFAPSGLSTVILHEWQHYDDVSRKWQTTNTVAFPISGGRDGGYRGYSIKYAPTPGAWRVNVITKYGQLIGRISFSVETASSSAELAEQIQ